MISTASLIALFVGVALLLLLILFFRIHAFLALLICSIVTGLMAGLDSGAMIATIKSGMGGTLGFVATVVGLGAIFGAILEKSGGAQAIAQFLLKKFGQDKSPVAMLLCGFIVAIPVFFDVAFIILVPIIYSLQKSSKKSLLYYAIPLLAGLAITHSFIPPTPGPVAVADILGADLGSVILIGFLVGIPTALVSGLMFGKYIAKRIHIDAPMDNLEPSSDIDLPSPSFILAIIAIPIALILLNTGIDSNLITIANPTTKDMLIMLGHPFSALIIANLIVWYVLGIRRGFTKDDLFKISSESFKPVGTIILLTGAGGVFKQVLVDTEIGEQIANTLTEAGIPIIFFAFIAAAIVRVLQGSATTAMITAAGLVSPLLIGADTYTGLSLACIVIAIASGASIFSHVNDSGFWLVSQYLGTDEKQTFRSWTMMTTLLALSGLVMSTILFYIV